MRYKEYKLGDVFSVESVNKLSIPGKNYIMDRDIVDKDGTITELQDIRVNMMPTTKEIVLHYQLQQIVPTPFSTKKVTLLDVNKLLVSEKKTGNIWDITLDYILFQSLKRLLAVLIIPIS